MKIQLNISSLITVIYWILILAILFPWIAIISKFNFLNKILELFENLMSKTSNNDAEPSKKMAYFIKIKYLNQV